MSSKNNIYEFIILLAEFIKSRIFSHLIYLIIATTVGFSLSETISLSDLKQVTNTLQNISAAVFTLAGIWIAYSYPQAISAYTSPNSVKIIPSDETNRIENLVLIILTSAFVISSLLIFNLIKPPLTKLANQEQAIILRSLGISFVFYISFLQLKAIFTVMATNIEFVNELHSKKTEKSAHDDL